MARFETNPWTVPPRLPLGDAFSGVCRAPGTIVQPEESQMREVCNLGYGRHGCGQFPGTSVADSIRFHVAKDQGELINIQYVFEKDCWPGERGTFDYTLAREFSPHLADETLRRQAGAFIESYLKRRNQT
ncbi:MAG: hypothetical protein ABSG13_19860 [Bryobacteraceae bacterium]